MNLFYQPAIAQGALYLDPDESRHCIKVLRRHAGDIIRLTDGLGVFYEARITKADERKCLFEIVSHAAEPRRTQFIHIAISPTKNADRIEWFVEKATELGIDKITLLECHNTERAYVKKERLDKVAVSAMKQSLKATLPTIAGPEPYTSVVASATETSRFIAFVDHHNPLHLQRAAPAGGRYLVLIGPEGDFTPEELDQAVASGFQKVSLGPSRLRTETAGLAACHILNLIN